MTTANERAEPKPRERFERSDDGRAAGGADHLDVDS